MRKWLTTLQRSLLILVAVSWFVFTIPYGKDLLLYLAINSPNIIYCIVFCLTDPTDEYEYPRARVLSVGE